MFYLFQVAECMCNIYNKWAINNISITPLTGLHLPAPFNQNVNVSIFFLQQTVFFILEIIN